MTSSEKQSKADKEKDKGNEAFKAGLYSSYKII